MSKEKPSAAYNHGVFQDITSILKTGRLHPESKAEAFIDGVRIPGSDRAAPLPDGLVDVDEMEPLFEKMQRISIRRDGCTAQFQGKSAFRGMQTARARLGVECEDRRNPAHHGKCNADGDTQVLNTNIKNSARDDYGEGTQNLVRHMAAKYPKPRTGRFTRHIQFVNGRPKGLYTADMYVYLFYPEGAFDDNITAADEGYSGSSKDHFYVSVGDSIEESNLKRRQRTCPCKSCGEMQYDLCQLTEVTGAKPTNKNIRSARPASQVETRGTDSLAGFCKKLSVRDNVIVKIAAADRRDYPDDQYFVSRIIGKPRQLETGGWHSTNHYRAGTWVATVRWYNIDHVDGANNRWYKLLPAKHEQVMPCYSFVRGLNRKISLEYNQQSQMYKLSEELDSHIVRFGSLAAD